jgi:hypothetical protein
MTRSNTASPTVDVLGRGLARGFSSNLDEHVAMIERQVARSLRDGESRRLAVKIVSGSYDYVRDRRTGKEVPVVKAYGKTFMAPPNADVCPPKNDQCEIERIWDFMVLNFRYTEDPYDIDTFQTLKESLTIGGGDCDDASVAFATLFRSIGYQTIARVVSTKEEPSKWVHIYPLVGVPKNAPTAWVPLDLTVEGAVPGWEYPNIAKKKDYVL